MKHQSRRFINLIYKASSKWANWDPVKPVKVGDYGIINKDTGEFEWKGNIYNPHFQQQIGLSIDLKDPAFRPQDLEAEDDKLTFVSSGGSVKSVTIGPTVNMAGVVNATLNLDFQFSNDTSGAALIVYKPKYTCLPNHESIVRLFEAPPDVLKEKCIVTEVISCSAYLMHLYDNGQRHCTVSLSANAPIPGGVNAGGNVGFTWSSQVSAVWAREGTNPMAKYTPLFRLKMPPKKWYQLRRGQEPRQDGIVSWTDIAPLSLDDDDEGDTTKPPKRFFALLIGINEYCEPDHNLFGAVRDVHDVRQYLRDRLHVPSNQISIILDSEATKKAILDRIRALENDDRIEKEDPILIYYSGHGAEAQAPEDWAPQGSKIQLLVPHDEEPIPDRTLGYYLGRLAEKKGNNITVIFDCCHSGSGTRKEMENAIRKIRSISIAEIPLDLDRDIWGASSTESNASTRSAVPAVNFSTRGLESHILLAACGEEESAIEENGRGVFTKALLHVLESFGADNLTYQDILHRLPILPLQNPQCEGTHQDRLMFNAKVTRQQTANHKIRTVQGIEKIFKMEAGAAHGIAEGAQFAVYQDDNNGSLAMSAPLGNVIAHKPDAFSTTMEMLPGQPDWTLRGDGLAVQVKPGKEEDLRLYAEADERLVDLCNAIVNENGITLVDKDQAELGIAIEKGGIVFNNLNTVTTQLGLTRMPFVLPLETTPQAILPILRAAAHYYWHIRRKNPKGVLQKKVELEFTQLVESETEMTDDYEPVLYPVGENLVQENIIDLTVVDTAQYGIKIINKGNVPLHTALFYFDNSDLSIDAYYLPPAAKGHTLLPKSSLTIGYGNTDTAPRTFFLREDQDLDVGFLKLFLSTEYIDLSHIPQRTPFVNHRGSAPALSRPRIRPLWDTILIPILQRKASTSPRCI